MKSSGDRGLGPVSDADRDDQGVQGGLAEEGFVDGKTVTYDETNVNS